MLRSKTVRWDSPFVLATAGTLAIHLLLLIGADAIVLTHPFHPPEPAPRLELIDVEVPPKPPPPPPPAAVTPPPEPVTPAPAPKQPVAHVAHAPTPPPTPAEPPPPTAPPSPTAGGDGPTYALPDNAAPTAHGIGGPRGTPGHGGPAGAGGGTGSGTGGGSGAGEAPVSVATIKQRAMPRGDTSYFDVGKDYPAEAKQLGIEGDIHVKLVVDAHGKVISRVLLDRLGHGLDELALARAAAIEFTPALDSDDKPVTSVVVWTFHMTLPK